MLSLIGIFLLIQTLYHFFVTYFGYGMNLIDQTTLAIIRDSIRLIIFGIYSLHNIKYRKAYLKSYWKILIAFLILFGFGIGISYFFFSKSFNDILIGIKYGLWWMFIILSSTAIGFFLQKRNVQLKKTIPYIKRGLIIIVIVGRIRQLLKVITPNTFYSMGYGKLDDFHYGENPPIYYLTGYKGHLRQQGIFSGPNNYGYFLVLFFPIILYFFPLRNLKEIKDWSKKDWGNMLIEALWIITIVSTLSRTAFIGAGTVIILYNLPHIRKNKKRSMCLFCCIVLALIGLSLLKRDSTIQHIHSKWNGIKEVINQPLGYGLGSSGPAVHHSGTFLPENYYIQLMLDLGTIGFLIRCGTIFIGLYQEKKLCLRIQSDNKNGNDLYPLFIAFQKGLIALFIMGLFLHVFEDSMVNYLFFIPYGIILGSLSCVYKNDEIP